MSTPAASTEQQTRGGAPHGAPVIQQFVNFRFFHIDAVWRSLPKAEREKHKKEFTELCRSFEDRMILRSYSTVGIRGECEFFLWRIAENLETIQELSSRMLQSSLGPYISIPHSFLAMTKRSMYIDRHGHPGSEGDRTRVVPGKAKYLFVYPFVKNRQWYALPKAQRQELMDEHIKIGHKYTSVKIHTTYSFGLDDQEFTLAFESDSPGDFLNLVMELRESRASSYTERDTPIFTGIAKPLSEILDQLG